MAIAERDPIALVDTVLVLQDQVLRLQDALSQAQACIGQLEARIHQLEARLNQDSGNSHQPPSSDGYTKPSPKSLREKSGRPAGGQKGHAGHTLKAVAHPDHRIVHALVRCAKGHGLRHQPVIGHECRQVFDLPVQSLEVIEHQAEVKWCPECHGPVAAEFPAGIEAPTQYGPRFLALLVYLRDQQLLPLARICQMAQDLWNQPLSKATIERAVRCMADELAPFHDAIADVLKRTPQLHADETGLRVNGQMHWLHVLSDSQTTWYGVHRKRGHVAMEDFSILPHYRGRLVHDELSAYWRYGREHILCNAHHLRELIFADEEEHQPWAKDLKRLLERAHAQRLRQGHLTPRQAQRCLERYRRLLAEASPPEGSKAHSLRRRLMKFENQTVAFLYDPAIPFTNNQAEQDLRMMKVQQKISGSFRTLDGARLFAQIRSYISTLRKQRQSIWQGLTDALRSQPYLPAIL